LKIQVRREALDQTKVIDEALSIKSGAAKTAHDGGTQRLAVDTKTVKRATAGHYFILLQHHIPFTSIMQR